MTDDADRVERERIESAAEQAMRSVEELRALLEGTELDARASAAMDQLEQARAKLSEAAHSFRHHAGAAIREIEGDMSRELDETESRIRANPLGAVAVAAVVGLLVGLALSRRR